MKINKGNNTINSVDDWRNYAPPKDPKRQWVDGRSAMELAKIWVASGKVVIPPNLLQLLNSIPKFKGVELIEGEPEANIKFDKRGGPRNADLSILGTLNKENVAITIEAKADEQFGNILCTQTIEAFEEKLIKSRSQRVERIIDLLISILPPHNTGLPKLETIRYQLLTGIAGTIAYANNINAKDAIFIVHEFHTSKTSQEKIETNTLDLNNFMKRLSNGAVSSIFPGKLYGPFIMPGLPLFDSVPDLYIGKIIN